MIQFGEPDAMDLALIDELPIRKAKTKQATTRSRRSILPWFRKREKTEASPQPHLDEGNKHFAGQPEPQTRGPPTPPRKSSQRYAKDRPANQGGQDVSRRGHHAKEAEPTSPKKKPREMEVILKCKTVITRDAYDRTQAKPVPPKTQPLHNRDRHTPLLHPVERKTLSAKLQEAEAILAEDSGQGSSKRPLPLQNTVNVNKPKSKKQEPHKRQAEQTQPESPPLETQHRQHSFSPTPPGMVGKRESSTPKLPPITWQYSVGKPSSSVEEALDDVARKLDEMDGKPVMGELPVTLKSTSQRGRQSPLSDRTNDRAAAGETAQEKRHGKQPSQPLATTTTNAPQTQTQEHSHTTSSSSFTDTRLQRAVAMRKQRLAAEEQAKIKSHSALGDAAPSEPPDRPPPAVPTDQGETILFPPPPRTNTTTNKRKKRAHPTKTAESLSIEDLTVDHRDRDIADRDVLKGLKLAISAACDENLDIWIRGKTGLRLRRFLADLKTFEGIGDGGEDGLFGTHQARRKSRVGKGKGKGKEVMRGADDGEWEEIGDER